MAETTKKTAGPNRMGAKTSYVQPGGVVIVRINRLVLGLASIGCAESVLFLRADQAQSGNFVWSISEWRACYS
jgi:hypothetical protein